MMNRVVISLGSNINPEENIKKAKQQIGLKHRILAESAVVETKPVDFSAQPNFLNGVVLIETGMNFSELKDWLHQVENQMGRVRETNKYGPRTIDLDVVVWNGQVIDEDMNTRDFLRVSVLEVWPDLIF
ncbi:2-amino-4-hydroxy-6-hydroxymethyldihydropteridine diphosphokinase [bacterium]|nr:2-amino-4-hydroxy-6-hydroxymethyldihydropteridine diphosphokinase [bacterium]